MQLRLRLRGARGVNPLSPLLRAWRSAPLAGVDEAGRGCLAGPVVAAAVILPWPPRLPGLADSKRLSAPQRESLHKRIEERALAVGIGVAEPAEIDALNVLRATHLAMRRAVAALPVTPSLVVVDGYPAHGLPLQQAALIDGDERFAPVSAASIVAKVFRDRIMLRCEAEFPGYGFALHKGYATPQHLQALSSLGPCRIHRMSFAPVAALCEPRLRVRGAGD